MKRILDIIISFSALILFFPFGFIISTILKLTGEGEFFFLQPRIGKDRNTFHLIKFATMLRNSPNLGTKDVTIKGDPRVLPFGKFLRKTKLNEVTQLLNVFKGDMSIVGPRPLTQGDFNRYSEDIKNNIIKIKPGLTGIGSIVFRDEENIMARSQQSDLDCYENEIVPRKGKLELWYFQNQSMILDLKIIFLTAWVVIFPQSHLPNKIIKGIPELYNI